MNRDPLHEIDNLDPDLKEKPLAIGKTAEIYDSGNGWAVKLFPFGTDKETAFTELDALKTAWLAKIPVPEPGDLVLMKMRWGFAMAKVAGQNGMALIEAGADPAEAGRRYAELHFSIAEKPGKFLTDITARFEQKISASSHLSEIQKERLISLLKVLPTGSSFLHGDFHPGNVIWPDEQNPVFVDWAQAGQGHPASDIARSLVLFGWQTSEASSGPRTLFTESYFSRWKELSPDSADLALKWLPILRALRLDEPVEDNRQELLKLIDQE